MNKEYHFIAPKNVHAAVKHVTKAVSKDDGRPALQQVRIRESDIAAADGWRLHAVQINDPEAQMPVGLFTLETSAERIHLYTPEGQPNFPDLEQVQPRTKIIADVMFNAKFLKEAIASMDGPTIRIVFHQSETAPAEFFGSLKSGEGVYSLLMPMYQDGKIPAPVWRPTKE